MSKAADYFLECVADWHWCRVTSNPHEPFFFTICCDKGGALIQAGVI
jgi:hypothetical protein